MFLSVLLLLFDKASLGEWIVDVASFQRHYLPLFIFLITGLYMGFLMLKAAVQWTHVQPAEKSKTRLGRDLLLPFTINLHRGLFIFLTSLMIVFVLKSLLVFAYGAPLPFFTYSVIIIKIGMLVGILYTYFFLHIAVPVIRRGHSFDTAENYFNLLIALRWKKLLPKFLVQLLLIFITLLAYKWLIDLLTYVQELGLLNYHGKPLLISFPAVESTRAMVLNTLLLAAGFLVSNLLYSPFLLLANKVINLYKVHLTSR